MLWKIYVWARTLVRQQLELHARNDDDDDDRYIQTCTHTHMYLLTYLLTYLLSLGLAAAAR